MVVEGAPCGSVRGTGIRRLHQYDHDRHGGARRPARAIRHAVDKWSLDQPGIGRCSRSERTLCTGMVEWYGLRGVSRARAAKRTVHVTEGSRNLARGRGRTVVHGWAASANARRYLPRSIMWQRPFAVGAVSIRQNTIRVSGRACSATLPGSSITCLCRSGFPRCRICNDAWNRASRSPKLAAEAAGH